MAYDRYDISEERGSRWRDDDDNRGRRVGSDRERMSSGGRDDRGFFERAGDEISSWFGDEDAERRRQQDRMFDERSGDRRGGRDHDRGYGRDYARDRERSGGLFGSDRSRDRDRSHDRDSNWNDNRGTFASGGSSERDYNRGWQGSLWSRGERDRSHDEDRFRDRGRDYRPLAGDYGRGSDERVSDYERSQSPYGRDDYRRTSFAGSSDRWSSQDHDPHYHAWKRRHLDELDRDYDDYRREHQSKFESEFGGWREKRQEKRSLLGRIREHMQVVGDDEKHVGTVDRIAGDRIILAKSDPDSGGVHHSLSCSDIGRVEGDRVYLDCSADKAKERWRDESRSRALFEREDQGDMGPRILDRSFEGTYR